MYQYNECTFILSSTKINPNSHLIIWPQKNLSRDIISYIWKILTCMKASILLHYLYRLNPIHPWKHTVKSHWISLNKCTIHENNSCLIRSTSTIMDDTNITIECCKIREDSESHNIVVCCIKSVNSLFMKSFWVSSYVMGWWWWGGLHVSSKRAG